MTKVQAIGVLPADIVNDIKSIFDSKSMIENSFSFILNLMNKSWRENKNINSYVEVPREYLRKRYNGHYNKWLNKLITSKIILSNNSYSTTNHICKSYFINPNYFQISPLYVSPIPVITFKTVSYSVKKVGETREEIEVKKKALEDFKNLKYDIKILNEILEKEIAKINISQFKRGDEIVQDTFEVTFRKDNREDKSWMTKEKAISIATKDNKTLIEDTGRYYIMTEDSFINLKKISTQQSYQDCLTRFEKKFYFAKRNNTNSRLDTNFTNMASCFSDYIFENNNLVKLDLVNAQFAILSDIFSSKLDTPDFLCFKEHSVNGSLYEYIQEKLNIKERKKAKVLVFELLFSHEDSKNPLKKELEKLFPSVVSLIDDFKKENGYKKFSVMLQKRESEIFIDGIWKGLKKEKKFCITKHDCLVVKKEDLEYVQDYVTNYFNKLSFSGKMIVEKFGK